MKHKILYESPYEYGVFSSEDRKSGRFYDCNGDKLPSVTTVLSGTKEGDFLKKWIDKTLKALYDPNIFLLAQKQEKIEEEP